MKYKLPRLNVMIAGRSARRVYESLHVFRAFLATSAAALCLSLPTLADAQSPANDLAEANTVTGLATPTVQTGQDIVVNAAKQMALHPSLEAKMRQRVGIREQYMVGTGAYLQLRHDDDVRFRLELRLQVGEQLTSLQHITDRRYLYIRRDNGDSISVSRIDLKRVKEARAESNDNTASTSLSGLGVGGLSQLLHGLADNFEFGKAQEETISGVNVWKLEGSWKPLMLAKLLPDQAESIAAGNMPQLDRLPSQLPHHVSLVVGRDGPLALFPYRVEFTRQRGDSKPPRSILIMELFEVRLRPELDPRLFQVPDSDQSLVDATDDYLSKHGLVKSAVDE